MSDSTKPLPEYFADSSMEISQIKRMLSALTIKPAHVLLFDDHALISGSSEQPYYVTMTGCTCADHAMTSKPCKHMYCYALSLGYQLPLPPLKENPSFSTIDEISRLRALYKSGDLPPETYVALVDCLTTTKTKKKKR